MLPFEGQWGINDSVTSQHRWRYSAPTVSTALSAGAWRGRERQRKGERHQQFWPNSIAYLKQFILSSWQSWTLDGSLNKCTSSTSAPHLKHTMSEERKGRRLKKKNKSWCWMSFGGNGFWRQTCNHKCGCWSLKKGLSDMSNVLSYVMIFTCRLLC